jgi:hypothetical protein
LAGALSFGASVPEEWGTLCSAEGAAATLAGMRTAPAVIAVAAAAPLMKSRRVNCPLHITTSLFNLEMSINQARNSHAGHAKKFFI